MKSGRHTGDGRFSRRDFFEYIGSFGVAGGLSGCIRLSQTNSTGTPETEQGQVTESSQTGASSSTSTPDVPELNVSRTDELSLPIAKSSPGTVIQAPTAKTVYSLGGRQFSAIDIESFELKSSVSIPEAINFGKHGMYSTDGEAFCLIGGQGLPVLKKITVGEGVDWEFKSEYFSSQTGKWVSQPVVNSSIVAFTIAVINNNTGNNETKVYVLNRATGELLWEPSLVAADKTFTTSICLYQNKLLLFHEKIHIYDISSQSFDRSVLSGLIEHCAVDESVVYTPSAAYDLKKNKFKWSGGASEMENTEMKVTDEYLYVTKKANEEKRAKIQQVDKRNGNIGWTSMPKHPGEINGIDIDSSEIWAALDSGYVYRFDSTTGHLQGATAISPERKHQSGYDIVKQESNLIVGARNMLVKFE